MRVDVLESWLKMMVEEQKGLLEELICPCFIEVWVECEVFVVTQERCSNVNVVCLARLSDGRSAATL